MPIFLIRIKIFNFGLLDPKEYLKLTKTWSKSKTFVSVSSLMAKNHRKQSRECGMPFVLFTAASLILQLLYLKVLKTNNYADFTKKKWYTYLSSLYIFSEKTSLSNNLSVFARSAIKTRPSFARIPRHVGACRMASMAYSTWKRRPDNKNEQ